MICCGNKKKNILREQDNMLWELNICCGNKISFSWKQNNKLWEQDIIYIYILREQNKQTNFAWP